MRRFALLVFATLLVVVGPDATAAVARSVGRGARRQASIAAKGQRKRPRLIVARAHVSYRPSPDALIPAATLTAPSSDGKLGFDSVAASDQTIASLSFDTQNFSTQTGVYAYGRPADGWSSSVVPAQLTAANGHRLDPVAVSDNTVVAGDVSIGDSGAVTAFVFARPSGGWSGSLHEAATLIAPSNGSGARPGLHVAISGATIFTSAGNAVYAFNEPPGGWSGTDQPSATLSASNGTAFDAIAVSGQTLVAASATAIYVFTEPAGGWSGALGQTASLRLPGRAAIDSSVAVSGQTIIVAGGLDGSDEDVYIFQESRGGWSATRRPSATLRYLYAAYELGPMVSISGGTVALATAFSGPDNPCPCTDSLYVVSQLGNSWAGTTTIHQSAYLSSSDSSPISINGQTLAVGAADGIHVYTTSHPPAVSNVTLKKLSAEEPQLALKATAGAGGQRIKSLTLQLPRALQIKTNRLARVRVSGAGPSKTRTKRNTLIITPIDPASKLSITIGDGALTKSAALSKALSKLSHPLGSKNAKSKRGATLKLLAQLLDADGSTTTSDISFAIN